VRRFAKGDDPGLVAAMAAQLAVQEETAYHQLRAAIAMAAVSIVDAPLITYGTAEQVSRDALRILGPTAALALPEAPGAGIFEQGLRLAILAFLGGGTNDVKRGLIAGGFGLA